MVGSVICFSIMDICVKWLDYYPVGQVLFLRFFIGFIPIFFIIPRDKIFNFYKTSRPGLHAFRAICGALAIIALFYGLREMHETDTWRVMMALIVGPLIILVCCCGCPSVGLAAYWPRILESMGNIPWQIFPR